MFADSIVTGCQQLHDVEAGDSSDLDAVILVRVSPISSLVHEKTEGHVLHSTANLFIHLPPRVRLVPVLVEQIKNSHSTPPHLFNKELGASLETIFHPFDAWNNYNILICSNWPLLD